MPSFGGDSAAAAPQLSSGVAQIMSTSGAFAALKQDGSVVTWGDPLLGGSPPSFPLDRVVAFATPFTDDRLLLAPVRPVIIVAVSPASVLEDGGGTLQ
jgi:hypothetical protein